MSTSESRSLDERALVRAAKAGDIHAYDQLVVIHQQTALRVAYLVLGSATDAEDVAQDAFIKAFRALGRFSEEKEFRPWLLAIVRNEARNRRRRSGRQRHLHLQLAAETASQEPVRSAESIAVASDEAHRLLTAVDLLPDRHREVIGLRYLVGLSELETAHALGVPVGTVKSRAARALERLGRSLSESPPARPEGSR